MSVDYDLTKCGLNCITRVPKRKMIVNLKLADELMADMGYRVMPYIQGFPNIHVYRKETHVRIRSDGRVSCYGSENDELTMKTIEEIWSNVVEKVVVD